MPRSTDELCFLMAHDPDEFNRWNAAQTLSTQLIMQQTMQDTVLVDGDFIESLRKILLDHTIQPALAAEILRLPAEGLLADMQAPADPERIHLTRNHFRNAIAHTLRDELLMRYEDLAQPGEYSIEPEAMGKRALRNLCLSYLMAPPRNEIEDDIYALSLRQYRQANNMTDALGALICICNTDDPERTPCLDDFYTKWRGEALVLDKWFSMQATCELPGTLSQVMVLTQHEAFNIKNPNKVRSLIGAFAHGNPYHFHNKSGDGYRFIAGRIMELDRINPQIAARLTGVFSRWQQYDEERQKLMKHELQRILSNDKVSKDVYEVAAKSLGTETADN